MVALTATHSHNNAPRWYHGVSSRCTTSALRISSTRSSATGSQARPNSRMQRSMLAVPNSRSSQSSRNSWIFCRDSRKRIDRMAMKLASAGPTRQRSVSCRLRRRPSISEQRPVPGRATVSWPHVQRLAK